MNKVILMLISTLTILLFNSCHNAEAAETRKKIVVVDTGISLNQQFKDYMCQNGTLGSESWIYDRHKERHGTNVVDLIGSRINTNKYCVVSINMGSISRIESYNKALEMTSKISNVVAVNLSIASGNTSDAYSAREQALIQSITQKGIIVYVAAGNDNLELSKGDCNVYPACLKYKIGIYGSRIKVIGSNGHILKKGRWITYSNTGLVVDHYVNGSYKGIGKLSGSSQATAIFVGDTYAN